MIQTRKTKVSPAKSKKLYDWKQQNIRYMVVFIRNKISRNRK